MIISRTVGENILLSKHDIKKYIAEGKLIKGFPVVDSNNPKHIENILGNELRVLKYYAPSFDFIANIISAAHRTGCIGKYIKDVDENYYKINVSEILWTSYFDQCGDFTIRQSIKRQVLKDLQTGFVLLPAYHNIHGRGMEKRAPFRIMAEQYYSDGTRYRELFFSKAVFGSLVTGECYKNGKDGYINIPSNFYPAITGTDKGILQSYNPIYKLHIKGIMKNTHNNPSVLIPRDELLEAIVPEYLDDHKYLKISLYTLHENLVKNIKEALKKIPEGLMVKNLYFGNSGGDSTLYFRNN